PTLHPPPPPRSPLPSLPSSAALSLPTPPSTSSTYPLSLHDALPIFNQSVPINAPLIPALLGVEDEKLVKKSTLRCVIPFLNISKDRKSTRLNSSHVSISYAVFCLKKKKKKKTLQRVEV